MTISGNQPVESCIFCTKAVTDKSFYSTSKFSAVYNLAPILPGHSLIIPNTHYESLTELSDQDLGEMMIFAREVTKVLISVFNCDGFDWTIQDGVSAGQTVPHLHLHIIPRKPRDLPSENEWYSKIPENERQMLDSKNRERLKIQEYDTITVRLAEAFKVLKSR
jgi:bis(5'-adenosyl)-triphosphatase